MMSKTSFATALLFAAGIASGIATAQSALPPVNNAGGVAMMSGGVGSDQAAAMRAESTRWPLTLEFSVAAPQRADYAANVQVAVRKGDGAPIVQTTSQGPLLLLRLPPGEYTVEATLGGKTLRQQASVVDGKPAKLGFMWPEGTPTS